MNDEEVIELMDWMHKNCAQSFYYEGKWGCHLTKLSHSSKQLLEVYKNRHNMGDAHCASSQTEGKANKEESCQDQ